MGLILRNLAAIGLLLDFVGATLVGLDLWLLNDYEILSSGVMRLGSENIEENRELPSVRAKFRQRRFTRIGMAMIAVGFLFQLIGARNVAPSPLPLTGSRPAPSWSLFYPTFVEVLAAVMIGLPLVLWLQRSLERRSRWKEDYRQARRAGILLRLALDAVRRNMRTAAEIGNMIQAGRNAIHVNPPFDTVRWPSIRDDLADLLQDPELHASLALHFAKVEDLRSVNEHYTITMSVADRAEFQNLIWNRLHQLSSEVQNEGGDLEKTLEVFRQKRAP